MVRHIEQVRGLVEQHQKTQAANYAAYQQRAQQEFSRTAAVADAEWQAWADTQDGPERIKEISTMRNRCCARR